MSVSQRAAVGGCLLLGRLVWHVVGSGLNFGLNRGGRKRLSTMQTMVNAGSNMSPSSYEQVLPVPDRHLRLTGAGLAIHLRTDWAPPSAQRSSSPASNCSRYFSTALDPESQITALAALATRQEVTIVSRSSAREPRSSNGSR